MNFIYASEQSVLSRLNHRLLLLFGLLLAGIGHVSAQDTAQAMATPPAESFRQPAFPGGAGELAKFLSRNLQYPAEAEDARVSGRVVVSFWVDETGRAYGFGAVQSPHPALEAEAMRVAKKISRWEPGLQEGKLATMQMYLPVVFKLMSR